MDDKQKFDRAFSILLEVINDINSNNILMGEHAREIDKLKKDTQEKTRVLLMLAANYFTKERIVEIHDKSVKLLKCNDFSETEYIKVFSDITTLTYSHVHFLIQRQNEIDSLETELNDFGRDQVQNKKTFISTLADILMKDGANDD